MREPMTTTVPPETVALGAILVVLVVAALTTFYVDYKATMLQRQSLYAANQPTTTPRRSTEPDDD